MKKLLSVMALLVLPNFAHASDYCAGEVGLGFMLQLEEGAMKSADASKFHLMKVSSGGDLSEVRDAQISLVKISEFFSETCTVNGGCTPGSSTIHKTEYAVRLNIKTSSTSLGYAGMQDLRELTFSTICTVSEAVK